MSPAHFNLYGLVVGFLETEYNLFFFFRRELVLEYFSGSLHEVKL